VRLTTVLLSALSLWIILFGTVIANDFALTPNEELGKAIFFDSDLSINGNQSCAACHGPQLGWTGPESFIPPVPDKSKTLPANDGKSDGCDSSRFKCVMGGEAVLDKQTGLIWARNTKILEKRLPWQEAVKFCQNVEIGGQKGWRLPTRDELIALLDTSRVPALPEKHPFTKMREYKYGGQGYIEYWTSTEYEGNSNNAWRVSFYLGNVTDSLKLFDFGVWPVRDSN
jgi:hypothetical protein